MISLGPASNDFLPGASYYPHPHPGTSPFYAPVVGGMVTLIPLPNSNAISLLLFAKQSIGYSHMNPHMYPHGAGPASTLSRGSSRDDLGSDSANLIKYFKFMSYFDQLDRIAAHSNQYNGLEYVELLYNILARITSES